MLSRAFAINCDTKEVHGVLFFFIIIIQYIHTKRAINIPKSKNIDRKKEDCQERSFYSRYKK